MSGFSLRELEAIVAARAVSDDERSYTRKLVERGVGKASQKLGEEAVETVIAAVSADRGALVSEAADLLYHLMVVLNIRGVALAEVERELAGRTGRTGLDEKAARQAD